MREEPFEGEGRWAPHDIRPDLPLRATSRRSVGLSLLLVLTTAGCQTTRSFSLFPVPDPESVAYINDHPEMHYGGWVATTGDTIRSMGLEVVGDRLRVGRGYDEETVEYRLDEVVEIGLLDRKGGFLRSMTAGVGIAAGAGLLGAALASPGGPEDRSRTESGLRVGAITAVFVLPVSFVLGVSGAHVIRFEVEVAPGTKPPGQSGVW